LLQPCELVDCADYVETFLATVASRITGGKMRLQNIRNFVLGCIFIAAAVMAGCGGEKVIVTPAPAATPLVQTVPASPALGVVATVPPLPPSPSEVVSVSPGTDYIWVKGYYNWDGSRYQWMPGTWVRASSPGAVWVPAHWQPSTGGYVWVQGAWQ
jgi:hypothetical protein